MPGLPQGVTVLRGPDWGPGTKLLLPRAAFPQADLIICDDDCLYAPVWADTLWETPGLRAASVFEVARLKRKGCLVAQGFAGVRVPPTVRVPSNIPEAVRGADDLWFSALWAADGVDVVEVPEARALVTPLERADALQEGNRAATYRAAARFIHQELGVWPEL